MSLGYKDPVTGEFQKVSSVQLSNTMKTSDDEAKRKACWEVRPFPCRALVTHPEQFASKLLVQRNGVVSGGVSLYGLPPGR